MHMISIGVRGDDHLRVLTKILSYQCFAYLVGKLGRDVFGICKTDNVVYSLDWGLTAF